MGDKNRLNGVMGRGRYGAAVTEVVFEKGAFTDKVTPMSMLSPEISLPAAAVHLHRMDDNIRWMQAFADAYGMQLAPHGKTTMSPFIFQRQINSGAWGITLATAVQAVNAARHGVQRVLMANQLIGDANCALVSEHILAKGVEFYCLVDDESNAQQLSDYFAARNMALPVLIEVGVPGGRCGVRSAYQAKVLAEKITSLPGLRLCGVEAYEGVACGDEAKAQATHHTCMVVEVFCELAELNLFAISPAILSGAGSVWFDIVAQTFAELSREKVLAILRPGCYVVHDAGMYARAFEDFKQRGAGERVNRPRQLAMTKAPNVQPQKALPPAGLQNALEIWAHVQSRPEANLAVIAFGKRDAAYDSGLPVPLRHFSRTNAVCQTVSGASQGLPFDPATWSRCPAHWCVERMMDQHTMLSVAEEDNIQVGDVLTFATSHPCLTFDKWRQMFVVGDDDKIIDTFKTYF